MTNKTKLLILMKQVLGIISHVQRCDASAVKDNMVGAYKESNKLEHFKGWWYGLIFTAPSCTLVWHNLVVFVAVSSINFLYCQH
jgi:hypothetical protein